MSITSKWHLNTCSLATISKYVSFESFLHMFFSDQSCFCLRQECGYELYAPVINCAFLHVQIAGDLMNSLLNKINFIPSLLHRPFNPDTSLLGTTHTQMLLLLLLLHKSVKSWYEIRNSWHFYFMKTHWMLHLVSFWHVTYTGPMFSKCLD